MTREQPITPVKWQPYRERRIRDEENTVPVSQDLRHDFEFEADLAMDPGPPWYGARPITGVTITGTILGTKTYTLDQGYIDPASVYIDDVEYEDISIEFWAEDLLVLRIDIDSLTEADMAWGRIASESDTEHQSLTPYYYWLDGNRDLSSQFPGADSLECE